MKSPALLVALIFFLFAWTGGAAPNDEIISHIKRAPIASSNVASIGYSGRLHALEIEFSRGAIYRFFEVPPAVYRALMRADSKGHFINTTLRGKYRYQRVRPAKTRAGPSDVAPNEQRTDAVDSLNLAD